MKQVTLKEKIADVDKQIDVVIHHAWNAFQEMNRKYERLSRLREMYVDMQEAEERLNHDKRGI